MDAYVPCGPGEMVKVGDGFVFNGYGNEIPNSAVKGESTAIHRHPYLVPKDPSADVLPLPGVHPDYPEVTTTENAWRHGVALAGDKPCLGWRPAAVAPATEAGEYTYISYNEADKIATEFGRGLVSDDLCPPQVYDEDAAQAAVVASGGKGLAYVKSRVGVASDDELSMRTLGFYMINQPAWVLACQGCNKHGITTVPLYATLGPTAVEFSINMLKLHSVVADTRAAAKLIKLVNSDNAPPSLKVIVVVQQGDPRAAIDASAMAKLSAAAGDAVQVVSFHDVQAHGAALDDAAVAALPTSTPKPLDIATISFTSGTTGDPKGAMLSHANLVATCAAVCKGEIPLGPNDVHLSYLPLAHIFERVMTEALLCSGARIGFIQGPTKKFLLKDLGVLHPTIFPSVPRLYNMIYDKTMAAVASGTACKSGLFAKALASKVDWLKQGYVTHKFWDALIFSKIKAKFGLDRIRVMITGAAPIPSHVIEFLRVAFCCPVIEGYGQTESAAASFIQRQADTSMGHVGCPVLCNECKLVTTATPPYGADETNHKGQPCKGRGEICFRGPGVFIGYFKNAQKTADAIDDDGWLHSGDIGIWLTNGALRIVDRKKNIFKTTRGECVRVARARSAPRVRVRVRPSHAAPIALSYATLAPVLSSLPPFRHPCSFPVPLPHCPLGTSHRRRSKTRT